MEVDAREIEDPNSPEFVEYVTKELNRAWLMSISKFRRLIICIPKSLVGSYPEEKLRNPKKVRTVVLYTLTYKNSPIEKQLRKDETLKRECDLYYKDVLPRMGVYNQDKWLAASSVYYLFHTNLDERINDLEFNFITDPRLRSLLTSSIHHQFCSMRGTINGMVPHLRGNRLFCFDDCSEVCTANNFDGHLSLKGLTAYEPVEDVESNLERFLIKYNPAATIGHPLHPLFSPMFQHYPEMSVEDRVEKVFNETSASLTESKNDYCVYVLLLVTRDDGEACNLNELIHLWDNRAATFELYIGITCQEGYRKEHVSGTGSSGVYARKRQGSTLFLVKTEICPTYEEARMRESLFIEICKIDEILAIKRQLTPEYRLINVRSERLWASAVEEERIRTCISFVINGNRLFRFPEENYVESDEFNFGNYLVERMIDDPSFLDDTLDEDGEDLEDAMEEGV
ncbi:unnamed protein product [Orchesella dallaii]|uniref:Stimulator of interferon genes protein n=1 Tax=Orchesella dallaii TaxID=48710 RepID=A0ABP1PSL8_9HEXA